MTKAQRFMTVAIPALIAYVLFFLHILPVPFVSAQTADTLLPVIPWWLLVTAGAYSLGNLGLNLYNFHECPEAYESLLKEITQAKNELRDRGVEVD